MEIKRIGSQPSNKGPADWFTGTVRIDPLFQAPDPARVGGASVTFEPGARTAWHTHPLGQTLIVTAGCGWAQREGFPSDAYATGMTLWALNEAGVMRLDATPAAKAVKFLLGTQSPDGSWHVASRATKFQQYFESGFPYEHDQWISTMATGWAANALALSLDR